MPATDTRQFRILSLAVALIAAVLVVYSQTLALTWDEGFHLLAAQLINAGKKPYLDFLFAQTPLNAYWNALVMRLFGQSWQTAHALAAIESAAAVMLTADYVFRRLPAPPWRLFAALATACLMGLNIAVVEFGTLGQAYGLCLLMTVIAFRCATSAPDRNSPVYAALAGIAAGAGAASSLLVITVAPVLLIWIALRNRAGNRWLKAGAFIAAAAVPQLPLAVLFLRAPHQVAFDVVDFHLFYRQVQWDGWQFHDLDVLTAWLDCSQALILGALAVAGLFFIRHSGWPAQVRAEFYLCAVLAATTGAYLMTAHPTFQRYFLLITPFTAILAAAGLYGIVVRTRIPETSRWPVVLLAVLMAAGLARSIHDDSDDTWYRIEAVAKKVGEVTPPGAMLFADEHVYFILRRMPAPGMEWNGGHKVELPLAKAAPLHLLPRTEMVRQVKSGKFDTVETCGEGEPAALGLAALYKQKAEINDCFVFWDKRP